MIISKKLQLNEADVKRSIYNAKIFLAPLALMYSGAVVFNIQNDGFQWTDFKIGMIVIGGMVLYVLNYFTDIIKKFLEYNKYPEK